VIAGEVLKAFRSTRPPPATSCFGVPDRGDKPMGHRRAGRAILGRCGSRRRWRVISAEAGERWSMGAAGGYGGASVGAGGSLGKLGPQVEGSGAVAGSNARLRVRTLEAEFTATPGPRAAGEVLLGRWRGDATGRGQDGRHGATLSVEPRADAVRRRPARANERWPSTVTLSGRRERTPWQCCSPGWRRQTGLPASRRQALRDDASATRVSPP
jgi:hypothetical protein